MRVVVVGLGVQGRKRAAIAGKDRVATADLEHPEAEYKSVEDIPLDRFDAALVCTPDEPKLGILEYLLGNGKHVLVEKPLITGEDARIERLRDLARARRVACYTAYNHRFEPQIVNLKSVIDSGRLGKVHYAKFSYGNGTAREVRNSPWRDQPHGMGVVPDLGSHLLDTLQFIFGEIPSGFAPLQIQNFENRSPDYLLFRSLGEPFLLCEATLLSWRNTFQADVFGEEGSAHVSCLCKWGPSTLTVRKRVLPSGRPPEETQVIEGPDPTWAAEYEHFKALCRNPDDPASTDLDKDLWINGVIRSLWDQWRSP